MLASRTELDAVSFAGSSPVAHAHANDAVRNHHNLVLVSSPSSSSESRDLQQAPHTLARARKLLSVDVLVVVVGQPSVPVAQVTQELCRPAFGPLAHSLHHQSEV
jgi:hypothetical protein